MKTIGLLITIALVLPLAACERRDRCDSGDGATARRRSSPATAIATAPRTTTVINTAPACHSAPSRPDGAPAAAATPRALVGRTEPAAFLAATAASMSGPGAKAESHAGAGGMTGEGGSRAIDAGTSSTGGTGAGGSGTATGGTGAGGSGTGGTTVPPGDAGAPHTCGTDGGPSCHPRTPPVCQFNHDCGLTGRCTDGQCQAGCTANADCGTGQVCTAGYCLTSTTSGGQSCSTATAPARRPASTATATPTAPPPPTAWRMARARTSVSRGFASRTAGRSPSAAAAATAWACTSPRTSASTPSAARLASPTLTVATDLRAASARWATA